MGLHSRINDGEAGAGEASAAASILYPGPDRKAEDGGAIAGSHVVQFYRDEGLLLERLTEFADEGLKQGESVILIAVADHTEAVARTLESRGVPVAQLTASGRLQLRDARQTLSRFMTAELPDAELFQQTLGPLIERARSASPTGAVRAYGEMVDLLWRDNKEAAMFRLEELWHDVVRRDRIALLCSYSLAFMNTAVDRGVFDRICAPHTVAEPLERSVDRLGRLQKVTASLSRAATVRDIALVAVREGLAATGALTGGLWLIDEPRTRAELVHDLGYPDEGRRNFGSVPLDGAASMPLLDTIRTGEPIWVRSRADLEARYPAVAALSDASAGQGIACLPILASGRTAGALSFTFEGAGDIDQAQRDFLLTIAHQAEVALERASLFERERNAREQAESAQRRASFKAEASAILASSLDYATTLRNVAKLAVPRFADWCVVELGDASAPPQVVAVEHVDPGKVDLVWKVCEGHPSPTEDFLGGSSVLRTGNALLNERIGDDLATSDAGQLERLRSLGLRSSVTVPMRVHGRTIGIMSFVYGESGRHYDEADLETAVMLGQRAGYAVENARLHSDLQRAVVARDDLIAVVSHDLRNLLGVMSMSAKAMTKQLPAGKPGDHPQRLADAVKRTTARMERLISDLLDFGGIESGRLKVQPRAEEVNAFLGQVLEDLRPLASSKSIQLEIAPPGEPLLVDCDRQRVFQVLSNLVGNAIKFTPAGGSILVEARADGDHVVLAVHDTGPGIEAAQLAKIFDRYYQGDTSEVRGVGLGLFIARGIVEAHGGRIWVESVRGQGSHFFFTLPRTVTAPAAG